MGAFVNETAIDSFEAKLERLHAQQMQVLQNSSPDDWHRYAFHHNWDDRLDGLFWIVSQPECDRSTALLIFWKGEPTGYDYEDDEEEMGDDIYAVAPMLKYISERFNTTGYRRAEIAYDFLEAAGYDAGSEYAAMIEAGRLRDFEALAERQRDLPNARVKLHPDMKVLRVSGRKVGGYDDESDFFDRLPEDLPEDLDDDRADEAAIVAASLPAHNSGADRRLSDMDDASDVAASARVRAIRHQDGGNIEEADGAESATGFSALLKRFFGR